MTKRFSKKYGNKGLPPEVGLVEFVGGAVRASLMNLSQEMMVFGGRQKLTSAMNKVQKVMVDFKVDALYR